VDEKEISEVNVNYSYFKITTQHVGQNIFKGNIHLNKQEIFSSLETITLACPQELFIGHCTEPDDNTLYL
jgi:hypothetical protein